MTHDQRSLAAAPRDERRLLGRVTGGRPGPTLIVLAAVHGNEPAGLEACRRLLAKLERDKPALSGELALLVGNLRALKERTRFVHLDLNRVWMPEKVRTLDEVGVDADGPVEDGEQRELLETLKSLARTARTPIHFLDLHTCSADGPPFVTIGDTLRNRSFARNFPLPLILGLEEQVDGAILEYLNNCGFITMGVEGGRHDSEDAARHLESVLWLALVAAGLLEEGAVPELKRHRDLLERAGRGMPAVVEVRHRHAITREDGFRMEPGFSNFQSVREGQVVGSDHRGEIRAPEDGLILLPLYQGKGGDGFFIAREVFKLWLNVSAVLRQLHLSALFRFLPGVRRHPDNPNALIINTRVARFYPLEIFHLFGFRKLRRAGVELEVSRRRHDLDPPQQITLG